MARLCELLLNGYVVWVGLVDAMVLGIPNQAFCMVVPDDRDDISIAGSGEGYRITHPTGVFAMSMFSGSIVHPTDTDGCTYRCKHLKQFEQAEEDIVSAMKKTS